MIKVHKVVASSDAAVSTACGCSWAMEHLRVVGEAEVARAYENRAVCGRCRISLATGKFYVEPRRNP